MSGKHTKSIALLLFTLLLLNACASNQNRDVKKLMNYYSNTPQDEYIYWGIGMGKTLAQATQNSRIDISGQVYSKIYSEVVMQSTDSTAMGANESITSMAQVQTESELEKVKRLDYKLVEDTYIVLSYLNRGEEPVNEGQLMRSIARLHKKHKTWKTVSSFFVPGTGQLIDGDYLKGGLMLTGALGAGLGIIAGALQMQTNYNEMQNAPNPATYQHYQD